MNTKSPIFADRLARVWADLFNPLFLSPPLFLILAILNGASLFDALTVFGIALLMFCLLPFWYLFHLKRQHLIGDLDIIHAASRNRPYLFGKCCYFVAFLLFLLTDMPQRGIFMAISTIYLVNSAVYMLINHFTKISIHSAAMATFGTLILISILSKGILFAVFFVLFLCMTLMMMWSRVHLNFHTPFQTILGATLAATLTILQYNLYLNWMSNL